MTDLRRPGQQPDTDIDLFLRWNHHRDEDAVAALWVRYQRLATTVAGHILARLPDADDAASEVADAAFLRALQTFDPVRAGEAAKAFRNWYVAIVRNAARDTLRRNSRLVYVVDEAHDGPEQSGDRMDAAIDLNRVLPQVRAFVEAHFLPSDWRLLSVWLEHTCDGKRVPWSRISEQHDLHIETVVPFPAGSTTFAAHRLAPVVRLLETCLAAQVRVCGGQAEDEAEGLALERAERVAALLRAQLRVQHMPSAGGGGELRVLVHSGAHGERSVVFEVTQGARRSPAALRMRVTKVLLPRVRAHLDERVVGTRVGLPHGK